MVDLLVDADARWFSESVFAGRARCVRMRASCVASERRCCCCSAKNCSGLEEMLTVFSVRTVECVVANDRVESNHVCM